MSDMFVTPAIDEFKMVEDAKYKSKEDRISNPDVEGVVVHYHSARDVCRGHNHRFFLDGEEVNGPNSATGLRGQ